MERLASQLVGQVERYVAEPWRLLVLLAGPDLLTRDPDLPEIRNIP